MEQDTDTIQESFDAIPEEVKHYIYGQSFTLSFSKLCVDEGLSEAEISQLKAALYGYLAQLETEESLLLCISSVTKSIESNQRVIDWIRMNVTEKVLDIVAEAYVSGEDEDISSETTQVETPASKKLFTGIEQRLSESTTIAPTKRDYSVEKLPETASVPPPTPSFSSIDPYREMPEK